MHAMFLADTGNAIGGAAVGLGFLFIIGLVVLASVFWIWMLVDCLGSALPSTEKLIWTLVILFLHLLGAVLYFAIVRQRRNLA